MVGRKEDRQHSTAQHSTIFHHCNLVVFVDVLQLEHVVQRRPAAPLYVLLFRLERGGAGSRKRKRDSETETEIDIKRYRERETATRHAVMATPVLPSPFPTIHIVPS